jgi:hypothetical protein
MFGIGHKNMKKEEPTDNLTGEPLDVDGECNARLYIGDNYQDNHVTMRCSLLPNHEGPHKEEFIRSDKPVTITWFIDEKDNEDVWY